MFLTQRFFCQHCDSESSYVDVKSTNTVFFLLYKLIKMIFLAAIFFFLGRTEKEQQQTLAWVSWSKRPNHHHFKGVLIKDTKAMTHTHGPGRLGAVFTSSSRVPFAQIFTQTFIESSCSLKLIATFLANIVCRGGWRKKRKKKQQRSASIALA